MTTDLSTVLSLTIIFIIFILCFSYLLIYLLLRNGGAKNEISLTETMTAMWHKGVVTNLKKEIKNRTRIGFIEGMPKAMPDIIHDFENWDYWVQFNNFSVKTMTENLNCINIYEDYQNNFTSLETYFTCINALHNTNGKYAAATVWL